MTPLALLILLSDREGRGSQFVFLFPVSIESLLNLPSDASFSWVLIAFKREFPFHDVLRLWEVLWTDYYSNNFVLFVALAILESHRDMILRYLVEVCFCSPISLPVSPLRLLQFDEILKVSTDGSGYG